jgi:hypothetical protein
MDWVTASALATAGGTFVLALATFSATRSANRSVRIAERQLTAAIRPLLVNSREQDPSQKIGFADQHYVRTDGGRGSAEATDETIYLTMSLRNVGDGLAVLQSWTIEPGLQLTTTGASERPDPAGFRRLTRDIYVPAGDVGFWQGALRDPADPDFSAVRGAIERRDGVTIHVLYGDVEGGQRVISRFTLQAGHDDAWLVAVARHWNLDRPDPR